MRNIYLILLVILVSCKAEDKPTLTYIQNIPSIGIRALEISENTVWFAGQNGTWGYLKEDKLVTDSIIYANGMDFRSISVLNDSTVLLLTAGSPALLFKTNNFGKTWQIVYQDNHPEVFFDSMTFWDENNGIAFGDPIDSCFTIIRTTDAGQTWYKLACDNLPQPYPGEAAFAASNTCISVANGRITIATGGVKSRLLVSEDAGTTWQAQETPIIQGSSMTGTFTHHFFDEKVGILMGGDFENKTSNQNNKILTTDGGKSWQIVGEGQLPGYTSCVQFTSNQNKKLLFSCGEDGVYNSVDLGKNWKLLSPEPFNTLRVDAKTRRIWLAGKAKLAFLGY